MDRHFILRDKKIVFYFLVVIGINFTSIFPVFAQENNFISLVVRVGGCHGVPAENIEMIGKKATLKKFITKNELIFFKDNCSYLLESTDQIISTGTPVTGSPDGNNSDDFIYVKKTGDFIDLYKIAKRNKTSGEVCVDSEGHISFTLGTENGSITFSTSGKFSISTSSGGIKHSVEF